MNVQTLACSILVCATFGFVAGAMDPDRLRKEMEVFPTNLSMFNNKGKLIAITTENNPTKQYTGRITFTHYTKKNGRRGQQIKINDATTLKDANFDANKPTYFIAHGWLDTGNGRACTVIRNAYLLTMGSNVIVVDWSKYSLTINYIDASYKVRNAGRVVANMIKYLYTRGLRPNKTTLVGHSLGAHVMGIAGYIVKPQVKNIVGLDPALPMFNFALPGDGLSKNDAQNVQIMHTNAGGLGYLCPHGHSDFFPNGGIRQAGCCNTDTNIVLCAICSHNRAFWLFAESITRNFTASRCDSYVSFKSGYCSARPLTASMGGRNLQLVRPGTYYLWTNFKKPFSEVRNRSISSPDFEPFFANAFCDVRAIANTIIY